MLSTTSILHNLKNKYPQFTFIPSNYFAWSSSDNIIYFDKKSPDFDLLLLHELSHALLGHKKYGHDIELISLECQAWQHTKKLASSLNINLSDELIQSNLDSYRSWMHARSTCPKCQAVGSQTDNNQYSCPVCDNIWKVNEARICALRRYKTKKHTN